MHLVTMGLLKGCSMKKQTIRQELLGIIRKDAFFKKKVVLSSGKVSNYYVDVRRISLSSRGIYLTSRLIWDIVKKEKATAFGGPTLGADPIVAGVCLLAAQEGKTLKGFIIRKEPKKHGRQNLIEGKELSKKDKIIIVDDTATSGSSLIKSIEALKQSGLKPFKAIAVVDREEGARDNLAKLNCPLISLFKAGEIVDFSG
jgi:orotate phosphoribosyltransferase